MRISIARPIEGISLNGFENLLDNNGNIMTFSNKEEAFLFLRANGHEDLSDDDLEDMYNFDDFPEAYDRLNPAVIHELSVAKGFSREEAESGINAMTPKQIAEVLVTNQFGDKNWLKVFIEKISLATGHSKEEIELLLFKENL